MVFIQYNSMIVRCLDVNDYDNLYIYTDKCIEYVILLVVYTNNNNFDEGIIFYIKKAVVICLVRGV
jgi:hypothetical protein